MLPVMQVGRVRPGAPPEHDVSHPVGGGLGQARPTNNIGIHGTILASRLNLETRPGISHDAVVTFRLRPLLLGLLPILLAGCGPSSAPNSANPASTSGPMASAATNVQTTADGIPLPGKAQPKLPTLKLWMGPKEVTAELALTPKQWAAGMMFRTNMADGEGMLFVFPERTRAAFWMKNTYVPLDGAYVDPEGMILEIHDMKPLNESSIQAGSDQIQYVLEVPRGWFARNGITTNVVIRTERGSLRETFFRNP
ncbi:MAG: DUF192 domain-containing protein [Verrucomicrobia bacterium]|nr:DUF192 domain-containing protein [Verrucomicrobiota bacterium]